LWFNLASQTSGRNLAGVIEPKLGDFSFSRELEHVAESASRPLYASDFVAPELTSAQGSRNVDWAQHTSRQTDIFALGVVMVRLLCANPHDIRLESEGSHSSKTSSRPTGSSAAEHAFEVSSVDLFGRSSDDNLHREVQDLVSSCCNSSAPLRPDAIDVAASLTRLMAQADALIDGDATLGEKPALDSFLESLSIRPARTVTVVTPEGMPQGNLGNRAVDFRAPDIDDDLLDWLEALDSLSVLDQVPRLNSITLTALLFSFDAGELRALLGSAADSVSGRRVLQAANSTRCAFDKLRPNGLPQ
jgi:serine/threonine protein kinase